MSNNGLRIAKVAAVVFALGVSAWIVMLAHDGANGTGAAAPQNPPEAAPSAPGEVSTDSFDETEFDRKVKEDPGFMFSSKSAMPIQPEVEAEAKTDKAKKEKPEPVFLPTSKSGIPIGPGAKSKAKPADGK